MVSSKEKESFKKLVKFIVIVTLAYLAFLELAGLIYLFSINEKALSHDVSDEDAPFPAFTVCARTSQFIRKEVLNKYKVKALLFEQNPEKPFSDFMSNYVKSQWINFDWGAVSLKQLYDEAVVYPHELIQICEVGDDYNCTQNKGIYHIWENVLKRSYSCSTLRIGKTIPYREHSKINVQFELLKDTPLQFQVHDTLKVAPRYINKYLHHQHDTNNIFQGGVIHQALYKYNVEKVEQLSENEGGSCSEDPTTDHVKCEEDCFEKQLLGDNSSCVLPWVMSPGRQCSTVDEALAMVKKEKEIQKIQCDCQDSCVNFRYTHRNAIFLYKLSSGNEVVIDNLSGITLQQEHYLYTFIDLLSKCGGSLSIFFAISLLGLLTTIIKPFCNLRCFSEFLASSFRQDLVKYLLKVSLLACLSLFSYEGIQLLLKFLENPKSLTVDRLLPLESPIPNVVICNLEVANVDPLTMLNAEGNFSQLFFPSPLSYMEECRLDSESCMTDGASFSWETVYTTYWSCSILRFTGGQYKELDIVFNLNFIKLYAYLSLWNTIPRYGLDNNPVSVTFRPRVVTTLAYYGEQKNNLPPCMENRLQCRERCWEQNYLKEDLCSPPEMPPTVKHKPCKTIDEFAALIEYVDSSRQQADLCQCDRLCLEVDYYFAYTQDIYKRSQSKLAVSLVPFQFTKTSEEWAYPFYSLIAGIGGMLGIIAGMSFLSVLDFLLKIVTWKKKSGAAISFTQNLCKIVVRLTIYGCFLQQTYSTLSHFTEFSVRLKEEIIDKESLAVLPHLILCDVGDWFYIFEEGVYAYHPDKNLAVTNDTINLIDWSPSWFHIEDYLTDCTVFGFPCNQQKGEIHEWHNVTNVNRFCSKLEIKPLKLQDYVSNKMVLKVSDKIRYYVSNKEENRLFHLQHAFDAYEEVYPSEKRVFTLHQKQYELLEEKPNNCINRLTYNRRNCLDQCVLDHVLEKFKCRFPWMEFQTSLPICMEYSEFYYLQSINSTFLTGCGCLPQCHYTENHLNFETTVDHSNNHETIVVITVSESRKLFKELWSYSAKHCLADLGGLLSLFTGLTLYDVFYSFNSYVLNLWHLVGQFLKCLRVSRVRM